MRGKTKVGVIMQIFMIWTQRIPNFVFDNKPETTA